MPPITEEKLFEAFGLDPKGSKGAQVQEPAEPEAAEISQEEPETGAQEQMVAESAQEEPAQDPMEPEEPEQPEVPETKPLSTEERRANAARRRQQEQQQLIDAAVAAERQKNENQIKDILLRSGLTDSATGEPITTIEQFNDWHKRFQTAQVQHALKKGQLTPEIMDQLIQQNPVVQQAQQVMQELEGAKAQQKAEADQARVDAEIAQISKLNPDIKKFEDILKMDTAPKFREYIGLGYRAIDAYKLANMDRISEDRGRKAALATMNNLRGKDHLKAAAGGRGGGDVAVPPSQMRMFRALNPGKSDAEIIRYYNNHIKNQGG